VYLKPPTGWISATENAKLTASDVANEDNFGTSVAISSDGTTIVAGAPFNAAGGIEHGAAYVYLKPPTGWSSATENAKLTAMGGEDFDQLGTSVAISSDGATIVAGAPKAAAGGNVQPGAAYVYLKPSSGWASATQRAKLSGSDSGDGDNVGTSVAVSSYGSSIVVGAPQYAYPGGPGTGPGAMYVFGSGSLTAPRITSGAPPVAFVGLPYRFMVIATGSPPPTITLSAGSLPPGLMLDSTSGLISGIPTRPGTYAAITITANNGIAPAASITFTMHVVRAVARVSLPVLLRS